MKNKYIKHTHISERKFREILKLFCANIEAKTIADLVGVNRNTINRIFLLFRERILEVCEKDSILGSGEIELDESYFGAKRVRGRRGRGAKGKIPVFGMLKRNGKVYTQVVKNCSMNELIPIVLEQTDSNATVYTDGWKAYDGLADYGYKRHYRVIHSDNEFANGTNHINGIENFWGLCKVRLSKFRGIHKTHFLLHLKECEFRYNNRSQDIYKILLKNFRKYPLN